MLLEVGGSRLEARKEVGNWRPEISSFQHPASFPASIFQSPASRINRRNKSWLRQLGNGAKYFLPLLADQMDE
jgi:hypothetical protein